MDKKEAKRRIDELRTEINGHNRRYYVENAPVISDFEYDMLMQELSSLEKKYPEFASADSPTVKVGSDLEPGNGGAGVNVGGAVRKECGHPRQRFRMLLPSMTCTTAAVEAVFCWARGLQTVIRMSSEV